jgi:hypothetical protein
LISREYAITDGDADGEDKRKLDRVRRALDRLDQAAIRLDRSIMLFNNFQ